MRLLREEIIIEGALIAKQQNMVENKKNDFGDIGVDSKSVNAKEKYDNRKKYYPHCQHCGNKGHPHHSNIGENLMLSA